MYICTQYVHTIYIDTLSLSLSRLIPTYVRTPGAPAASQFDIIDINTSIHDIYTCPLYMYIT